MLSSMHDIPDSADGEILPWKPNGRPIRREEAVKSGSIFAILSEIFEDSLLHYMSRVSIKERIPTSQ